jgi:hypothetical protein
MPVLVFGGPTCVGLVGLRFCFFNEACFPPCFHPSFGLDQITRSRISQACRCCPPVSLLGPAFKVSSRQSRAPASASTHTSVRHAVRFCSQSRKSVPNQNVGCDIRGATKKSVPRRRQRSAPIHALLVHCAAAWYIASCQLSISKALHLHRPMLVSISAWLRAKHSRDVAHRLRSPT